MFPSSHFGNRSLDQLPCKATWGCIRGIWGCMAICGQGGRSFNCCPLVCVCVCVFFNEGLQVLQQVWDIKLVHE